MKTYLLIIALALSILDSKAQTNSRFTFVIVRVQEKYDRKNETPYYVISAEGGNPYAMELYNLKPYKTNKLDTNEGGTLFSRRNNRTEVFYNYFETRTEAIFFMSQCNWELFSISNEIGSGYEKAYGDHDHYPYTTISSLPVFYMRKCIE